jgi:hypothetical protein
LDLPYNVKVGNFLDLFEMAAKIDLFEMAAKRHKKHKNKILGLVISMGYKE